MRKAGLCSKCGVAPHALTSGWCGPCRRDDRAVRNRAILRAARELGCLDCGLQEPDIMELDHVPGRGDKRFNLGQGAMGRSTPMLVAELAKCDTLCPNCHRRRTNYRRHDAGN